MAITTKQTLNEYTVKPTGHIEVRLETALVDETGAVIGYPEARYWRGVVAPGDTAKADQLGVRHVADIEWTPEKIAAEAARAAAAEQAA